MPTAHTAADSFTRVAPRRWALGVMLYELLVGKTPFCDDSHKEVLRKIASGPVVMPAGLDPVAAMLVRTIAAAQPPRELHTPSLA